MVSEQARSNFYMYLIADFLKMNTKTPKLARSECTSMADKIDKCVGEKNTVRKMIGQKIPYQKF